MSKQRRTKSGRFTKRKRSGRKAKPVARRTRRRRVAASARPRRRLKKTRRPSTHKRTNRRPRRISGITMGTKSIMSALVDTAMNATGILVADIAGAKLTSSGTVSQTAVRVGGVVVGVGAAVMAKPVRQLALGIAGRSAAAAITAVLPADLISGISPADAAYIERMAALGAVPVVAGGPGGNPVAGMDGADY